MIKTKGVLMRQRCGIRSLAALVCDEDRVLYFHVFCPPTPLLLSAPNSSHAPFQLQLPESPVPVGTVDVSKDHTAEGAHSLTKDYVTPAGCVELYVYGS